MMLGKAWARLGANTTVPVHPAVTHEGPSSQAGIRVGAVGRGVVTRRRVKKERWSQAQTVSLSLGCVTHPWLLQPPACPTTSTGPQWWVPAQTRILPHRAQAGGLRCLLVAGWQPGAWQTACPQSHQALLSLIPLLGSQKTHSGVTFCKQGHGVSLHLTRRRREGRACLTFGSCW